MYFAERLVPAPPWASSGAAHRHAVGGHGEGPVPWPGRLCVPNPEGGGPPRLVPRPVLRPGYAAHPPSRSNAAPLSVVSTFARIFYTGISTSQIHKFAICYFCKRVPSLIILPFGPFLHSSVAHHPCPPVIWRWVGLARDGVRQEKRVTSAVTIRASTLGWATFGRFGVPPPQTPVPSHEVHPLWDSGGGGAVGRGLGLHGFQ